MARIIVNAETLIGIQLLSLSQEIIAAQRRVARLKNLADAITDGGVNTVKLETSVESLIPAGSGATIYTGIVSIKTSLDSLNNLISSIDKG